MKRGEKLDIKSKVLIPETPKEHYVIVGFQLDDLTKELTGYSYVIEIK